MNERQSQPRERPLPERMLLRPREAAEVLGLHETTIRLMIAAGDLPTVRIGKATRVPVPELRRWVESRTEYEGQAKWPPKRRQGETGTDRP